jgi:diguanylate cyclase (GGDEF)-like protein
VETERLPAPRGLTDIFEVLTYRERYEALVETVGRDSLTGLLHRGRFQSDAEQAISESLRTGQPLSLLVLDVDHFKSINDRFGHAEGDRVLKSIATLLVEAAGENAQVYRIGGEEFAILCPHPHGMARLLGENIRHAVHVSSRNDKLELSVSAGVATVGRDASSVAALFAQADERLYEAKANGRDRVVGEAAQDADGKRSHA